MQRWRRVLVLVPGMLVLALLVAILVPFLLFGEDLEAWAGTLLRPSASPVAAASVVFLLLAADIVLPLPSSLIATAAGAQLGWGLGTVTVFAGLTAGHATGYALGHVAGRRAMIYARGTKASGDVSEPSAVPGLAVVVTLAFVGLAS